MNRGSLKDILLFAARVEVGERGLKREEGTMLLSVAPALPSFRIAHGPYTRSKNNRSTATTIVTSPFNWCRSRFLLDVLICTVLCSGMCYVQSQHACRVSFFISRLKGGTQSRHARYPFRCSCSCAISCGLRSRCADTRRAIRYAWIVPSPGGISVSINLSFATDLLIWSFFSPCY